MAELMWMHRFRNISATVSCLVSIFFQKCRKQNLSRLIRLTDFFGITDSSGLMPLSRLWDNGIINNGPKQPTVADLEAQVKAGFSISLTELAAASHREQKKPSVLEKLRERTPEQSKNKTAPKRSAEREL